MQSSSSAKKQEPQPKEEEKTSSSSSKMSTETQEPPKYEWLIVAPDYADVLEKRMAVRQYVISDQCWTTKLISQKGLTSKVCSQVSNLASGRWEVSSRKTQNTWAKTKLTAVGAFLSDVPKEGEPLKIIGSAMVALAATKEEVVERLKADVYNANGVWDLSKVR